MKGPEDLLDQNKKQIEYLQRQCRKAGKAILDLEAQKISLKKDIDRLSEEKRTSKGGITELFRPGFRIS